MVRAAAGTGSKWVDGTKSKAGEVLGQMLHAGSCMRANDIGLHEALLVVRELQSANALRRGVAIADVSGLGTIPLSCHIGCVCRSRMTGHLYGIVECWAATCSLAYRCLARRREELRDSLPPFDSCSCVWRV